MNTRQYTPAVPIHRFGLPGLLFAVVVILLAPSTALGWGAGMHATLNAHAHDRMEQRWKSAIDRSFLIYGSFGPDVWYILEDEFMESICGAACGPEDGAMANECWGDYLPDFYYNYARHLLVNAGNLQAVSYALGYAGHAVGDYRGHLEYIIPGWRNPQGNGGIALNRHTLVDSVGGVLAFNVQGLHGYPSHYTMDVLAWGYPSAFLTAGNLNPGEPRDPAAGLGVAVMEGRTGLRRVEWRGALDEAAGLAIEDLTAMMNNTALGAASEGIVAAVYGETQWDSTGSAYPIVIDDGLVAMQCSTDLAQRMQGVNGFGTTMACQINLAAISGLAQWDSFLQPAADEGDAIAVDADTVALWMDALAGDYSNGDVRLDDAAVFDIDPETGKSRADIEGIDGRHYTLGKTMPEIVEDVLNRNVEDIRLRLLENPHVVGTILQSRLNPVDKARFVDFGFGYRPRMTAWPASLPYDNQSIHLLPEAPGPFARVQIPVDVSPAAVNGNPDMVFPWYRMAIRLDTSAMKGDGRLDISLEYRDDSDGVLQSAGTLSVDIAGNTPGEGDITAALTTDGDETVLILLLDNRGGGAYFYGDGEKRSALTATIRLAVTDESRPPYNLIPDITLQPLCALPEDITATPGETPEAGSCPLTRPATDDDTDGGGGCSGGNGMLAALLACAWISRRRKKLG